MKLYSITLSIGGCLIFKDNMDNPHQLITYQHNNFIPLELHSILNQSKAWLGNRKWQDEDMATYAPLIKEWKIV